MKKRLDRDKSVNVRESWLYYKKEINNACNDLKHKDTFYKQIPNLLTLSRVVGMIPVSILMLTGNTILGIILLGLVLSTDFFDGKIARKYGLTSRFGADLDAVSDKVMAFSLMIPLLINSNILIFNIILEILISFANVRGRINGIDTKTLFVGKIKTCFLSATLFLGYLSKFISFYHGLFIFFSCLTSLIQLKTYGDYIKVISTSKKDITNKINNDLVVSPQVRKDDKLDELKRERMNLVSLNNSRENKNIKVRKRKK